MKKILFATLLAASVMPAVAQETYENAKIMTEDLNGTARYVGMGGAMEALGADISTIGSNPAGLGLFRNSVANISFGFVSQGDAPDMYGAKKTIASFDQAGFVWSTNTSGAKQSFFNFGFNYHKSRNFDYILAAADRFPVSEYIDKDGKVQTYSASQNKVTVAKAMEGLLYEINPDGSPNFDRAYLSCSQIDDIYAKALNYNVTDNTWYPYEASAYDLGRYHSGYVGEWDFNLSGNIDNRYYLGLTVGIHDVHYKHHGVYMEEITSGDPDFNLLMVDDVRRITGTGFDVKLGTILRPVEYSPFRIGFYVHTPTFYTLTTSNETCATDGKVFMSSSSSYKFKLYTPWKFGVSLGHTIGSQVALGATYEFASYGSADTRYITDTYYDYWDDYSYDRSESDEVMNAHTSETLKGVHTLKLGAEFKPVPELALRVGYNYVSPMFEENGFRDVTLDSDGTFCSTTTDYTNWKDTHRITAGLGYTMGKVNLSAAYQLSSTKGEFNPMINYIDDVHPEFSVITNPVDVKKIRHQAILTLGYTF